MKFIHTADWHLGKLFYGRTLTEEQEILLKEQFLPLIDEEKPDAVILAGDVYDRSVPPAEAVELFDEIVTKIAADRQLPFLVISGNHDSAERLSFASSLLCRSGLWMYGELSRTMAPVILSDTWGDVAFAPMPFAEPGKVRVALDDETVRSYEEAERALSAGFLSQIPKRCRKVAIAHAFVSGGSVSDSERPLSVGGSDQIPADVFKEYQYTALGHLHGPQKIGKDTVRYSGSLLKYSFSEAGQKKGADVVVLDGNGQAEVRFVSLSPRHDVRIMEGTFEELMKGKKSEDFLLARITDPMPVIDCMARLREKFPNVMALESVGRELFDTGRRDIRPGKVTEQDMFRTFVEETRGSGMTAEETSYMDKLWNELLKGDEKS